MSAASTDDDWFYVSDNQRHGPVPADHVRALWAGGRLDERSLLWHTSFGTEWRPLGQVAAMRGATVPPPLPGAATSSPTPAGPAPLAALNSSPVLPSHDPADATVISPIPPIAAAPSGPPARRPRRLLKILAFIAAGFVVLVGAVIGFAFWMTKDVTRAGEDFIAILTGPQPAAAWRAAGQDMQSTTTEADFAAFVATRPFQGATASWDSRNRNDREGRLAGTLTPRTGPSTRISLDLRQDATGVWKVIGMGLGDDALRN